MTNTTVNGLFANTGYMFRIKAQNKYGVGVPSVQSGKTCHVSCASLSEDWLVDMPLEDNNWF